MRQWTTVNVFTDADPPEVAMSSHVEVPERGLMGRKLRDLKAQAAALFCP